MGQTGGSMRKLGIFNMSKKKHTLIKEGNCNVCFKYGKNRFYLNLVYCVLPNGTEGYRIEYANDDIPFSEDLGTIIYSDKAKRWAVINW